GLGGSPPAEGLAWAGVQRQGDGVKVHPVVPVQVGALREVLAQESVGVLVRSALPRAVRVTEVDRQPSIDAELRVLSHLGPLVPGERPTELFGQRSDHPGDLVADSLGAVTSERWAVLHPWLLTAAVHWRKVQQHREPGGALHEGTNRGLVQPDDQVTFPVARYRPLGDFGWPLGDHDLRGDELLAAALRACPGYPQRAPSAQTGDELALERAAALNEQRLIDRLVRDPHGLILGEVELQPVRDLLRAPRRRPSSIRSTTVTSTDEPSCRTGNPLTVDPSDRASEPVLDVLTKPILRRQLRRLWAAGLQLRLPLRDRRPIVEPPATRGRIAA